MTRCMLNEHVCAVLNKKQKNAASEADDLFNQEADESDSLFPSSSGDLFSDSAALSSKPDPASPAVTGSQDIPPHNPSVPPPPSVGIETRFEEVYAFLRAFLVDKTEKRSPRDSVWKNLLNVAANRDQLERLVELMPRWRDAKRQFPSHTAAHFASAYLVPVSLPTIIRRLHVQLLVLHLLYHDLTDLYRTMFAPTLL